MIYLIYGTQDAVIEQEVKKIVKANLDVIDDFSYVRYDLTQTLIQDIVADAETMPFGVDKKVLSVKNSYIFTSQGPKKDKLEHDFDSLINYVKNENKVTTLIFSINAAKLDERSKLLSSIKGNIEIKKTVDVSKEDWSVIIKRLVAKKEVNFENRALEEFIERTKGDLGVISRELDKLKTYGGKITIDVINHLIARPLDDNMFNIIDALLSKQPDKALAIYNDLRIQNADPSNLVTALANQFRFLYSVKYLEEQGKDEKGICEELGAVNPYRVRFALRKTRNYSSSKILAILDELADIDYNTKIGMLDRFQAFELFLVKDH